MKTQQINYCQCCDAEDVEGYACFDNRNRNRRVSCRSCFETGLSPASYLTGESRLFYMVRAMAKMHQEQTRRLERIERALEKLLDDRGLRVPDSWGQS